jgi:hypothetical protein
LFALASLVVLPPVPELVGWQGAKTLLNDVLFISPLFGYFKQNFVVLLVKHEVILPTKERTAVRLLPSSLPHSTLLTMEFKGGVPSERIVAILL